MLGQRGKLDGTYTGVVVNNSDPENRQRLKIKCPYLFGGKELAWARCCVPPEYHRVTQVPSPQVPQVGNTVAFVFEAGNLDKPIWLGVVK